MKRAWRHYRIKRGFIFGFAILLLISIYLFKDSWFILRSLTALVFVGFFYLVDHSFDLRFKARHYFFIFFIAIANLLLSPLYYIYPNYDKIQHFVVPILISSMIFFMLSKLKTRLAWKLLLTFFVTAGILGIFEIGEYTLDWLFDLKLQGVYIRDIEGLEKLNLIMDPIDDTMIDLVLGTFGSALYCLGLSTYYYFMER